MPRRRLRLSWSSDEEKEDEDVEHEHQPCHLSSLQPDHPNSNFNANVSEPLPVSDDDGQDFIDVSEPLQVSDDDGQDFIDVSDHLSPPSPGSDHSLRQSPEVNPPGAAVASAESSGCPVSEFLRSLGLSLKREWLDACLGGLETSISSFSSLTPTEKGKLCFEQFLVSDMNYSGAGVLPENVDSMHLVDLPGPYVLQVDEIVNISCPLRGRYQPAPPSIKRCLKLSMTDGVQRVFGMEYGPIKDLEVLAPAGLKVVISNVSVRHGLLMLVPEALEVLGGLVEELDAARQRLVDEVNKPPRGRRTRTGSVPPLASRATLAAWPSNGVREPGHPNGLVGTEPSRSNPGVDSFHRGDESSTVPVSRANADSYLSSNFVSSDEDIRAHHVPNSRASAEGSVFFDSVSRVEDTNMVDIEHPIMLSGDREIPFTYMASLSTKWATMKERSSSLHGKIKCFLTAVKGFQFKQRPTFELQVYVDDGSLISEVLIDHNVVQKQIGHAPKDVTDALESSDIKIVSAMKETLRQFQVFLKNFEGTMLVEMNKTSALPLVLDMRLGCLESDAWLLLRRLERSNVAQAEKRTPLDPIDVSP